MSGFLCRAFGYQGNAMNLPVGDVASASTYYQTKLGFRVRTGSDTSHRSVVLTRDAVEMQLIENGGDPSQDGCAFHVTDVESLLAEFQANGVNISGLAGRAADAGLHHGRQHSRDPSKD